MASFQALLDSDDDMASGSEEETFEAGEDIDTDVQITETYPQSPSL